MNTLLRPFIDMGRTRWLTHGALLGITLGGIYATHLWYAPTAEAIYILTIGCGYLSLALLAVTLLIGPLKLLWQRRNPVNIDLRRDIGIWAAINGVVHVIFALLERNRSGIIGFFLRQTPNGYRLLLDRAGIANWVGLIATVILLLLLLTSNDWALGQLKGKRWKTLQRFNYGLAGLALLHTFLYQKIGGRGPEFLTATMLLALLLLVGQFVGIQLYRSKTEKFLHRHAPL